MWEEVVVSLTCDRLARPCFDIATSYHIILHAFSWITSASVRWFSISKYDRWKNNMRGGDEVGGDLLRQDAPLDQSSSPWILPRTSKSALKGMPLSIIYPMLCPFLFSCLCLSVFSFPTFCQYCSNCLLSGFPYAVFVPWQWRCGRLDDAKPWAVNDIKVWATRWYGVVGNLVYEDVSDLMI